MSEETLGTGIFLLAIAALVIAIVAQLVPLLANVLYIARVAS